MLLQSHAKALGSTAHRTLRLPNSTAPVTNSSHRHVPTTHPASHTNSRYPAATKSHHNGGLRATSDSNVRLKRKWRHSLASGHRVVLLLNLAAHSRLISNCFKELLSSSKNCLPQNSQQSQQFLLTVENIRSTPPNSKQLRVLLLHRYLFPKAIPSVTFICCV